MSKCMERCVYEHIHNHLLDNDILTTCQSGFTKGDYAVNQLINITNDFGKALDSGKEFGSFSAISVKLLIVFGIKF
jgi:hypothetical protein